MTCLRTWENDVAKALMNEDSGPDSRDATNVKAAQDRSIQNENWQEMLPRGRPKKTEHTEQEPRSHVRPTREISNCQISLSAT